MVDSARTLELSTELRRRSMALLAWCDTLTLRSAQQRRDAAALRAYCAALRAGDRP